MENDTIITLRCTKELRDKLRAAAKEVNMPVSVFLRIVLSRIVKQP
jgi:antitoxin component of RelBE/YafQ-DinJ toxin-antitoxin module